MWSGWRGEWAIVLGYVGQDTHPGAEGLIDTETCVWRDIVQILERVVAVLWNEA